MYHFNLPSNVRHQACVKIIFHFNKLNKDLNKNTYMSNNTLRDNYSNYDRIINGQWFSDIKKVHGDEIHAYLAYVITKRLTNHIMYKNQKKKQIA